MNITGYARSCRESFQALAFHDVDSLVLSQLCYYEFESLSDRRRRLPLRELLRGNLDELTRRYKNPVPHAAFLNAVADSPRFGDLVLSHFRLRARPEEEVQFCAMTFRGKDLAFLAFRGTDNSMTGWKEDMNMSFADSVPAQKEAVRYLKTVAKSCSLPLWLGGTLQGRQSGRLCLAVLRGTHPGADPGGLQPRRAGIPPGRAGAPRLRADAGKAAQEHAQVLGVRHDPLPA